MDARRQFSGDTMAALLCHPTTESRRARRSRSESRDFLRINRERVRAIEAGVKEQKDAIEHAPAAPEPFKMPRFAEVPSKVADMMHLDAEKALTARRHHEERRAQRREAFAARPASARSSRPTSAALKPRVPRASEALPAPVHETRDFLRQNALDAIRGFVEPKPVRTPRRAERTVESDDEAGAHDLSVSDADTSILSTGVEATAHRGTAAVASTPRRARPHTAALTADRSPGALSTASAPDADGDATTRHGLLATSARRPPVRSPFRAVPLDREGHLDFLHRAHYGEVPPYLVARRASEARLRGRAEASVGEPGCPAGTKRLPAAERLETLEALRRKRDVLRGQVTRLPLRVDTLRMDRRRAALEAEIEEVEKAIDIFSRDRVFVRVEEGDLDRAADDAAARIVEQSRRVRTLQNDRLLH